MVFEIKVLLEGLDFPEGPRWHDGKLWFSDMNAQRVMTVDLDGKACIVLEVPGQPSGLGWLPDGRLLVVSMTGNLLWRLDPGGLTEVAHLDRLGGLHCNDMVVDIRGRAYIGHIGFNLGALQAFAPASIIMVASDGNARVVADDMACPNGMVITPDGRTLIVAETWGACLTAFDIEADGSLTKRRIWAQLGEAPPRNSGSMAELARMGAIVPDGICLDAGGAVWVANAYGKEVLHVREGGEVIERITLSTSVAACMLGGPDRRTLFITVPGSPAMGRIVSVDVDVPGAGLP
jgi:sugar lactone lactonase YvrE